MIKLNDEFNVNLTNNYQLLEVWQPSKGEHADYISVSGAFIGNSEGELQLKSTRIANTVTVKQNLKSPRIAKLNPNNKLALACRFVSEPIECKKGDTLELIFTPKDKKSIVIAELIRTGLYDAEFYQSQKTGSKQSAAQYFSLLFSLYQPKSLVDFGCGVGTWIKQAHEMGVEKVLGLDGSWTNSVENYFDAQINFQEADLNQAQSLTQKFDMAMSLEVAEHLKTQSSATLVKSLCHASDAVLFGAAFVGQPGKDHINCQPHSFWADLFAQQGYKVFDLFRAQFWGHELVEPWYQQNTFLYIKENTPVYEKLIKMAHQPLQNIAFMDAVHPWLYQRYCKNIHG